MNTNIWKLTKEYFDNSKKNKSIKIKVFHFAKMKVTYDIIRGYALNYMILNRLINTVIFQQNIFLKYLHNTPTTKK